jgi:hypothetical protein
MTYPFTKWSLLVGIATGFLGGLVFGRPLAGFAWFVLPVAAGLVWRRDEPPVLSFALAFQWVFIVTGYLYWRAGGQLEDLLIGNVELAVFLSLVGLLCLAVGLRLGITVLRRFLSRRMVVARRADETFDIKQLFWITVTIYSVSWMIELSPNNSSSIAVFNAAQILGSILAFREVLFCLLWLTILRRREGYGYGIIAFVVALVPRFVSTQSTFKELIFMFLIVLLAEFRPWVKTAVQHRWHRRVGAALLAICVLLVAAGVAWEGAIKPMWRTYDAEGSPTKKLEAFAEVADSATSESESESWLAALIRRVSSITQFALVLDRVPAIVPHENGQLTLRAIKHILVPRVLFPNKENLGTDSWLAEEYAGLKVGEDTSVGIGYMAESYVDWGIAGLFPSLVAMGLLLGLAYALIFLCSPSYSIGSALAIVIFMNNFVTFEATLPKLLGGFVMNALILLVLSRAIPLMVRSRRAPAFATIPRTNAIQNTRRPTAS